jgi:hypothetical protein
MISESGEGAGRRQTETANPYFDAAQIEALHRQYELGRKDGYDEAVRMIKRAADALRKAKKLP